MNGRQNVSKNATPFKIWFEQMTESARVAFSRDNYLPEGAGLEFKDFMSFFDQRKEKLRNELGRVLALVSDRTPEVLPEWADLDDEIDEQATQLVAGAIE